MERIVANPSGAFGLANTADRRFWNIPGVPLANGGVGIIGDAADEVRFIDALIARFVSAGCVDPRRV
jgi:hypothetical protein